MNLHKMLLEREAEGRPIRVGLIGAGKFGAMYLAQARITPGIHVLGLCDLDVDRAREACRRTGWSAEQIAAASFAEALANGSTRLTDDAHELIAADGLEVVIDATGVPEVGIRHARAAIAAGRHVVMVNVEADALAGPLLARQAAQAGVVYSLAYGDQPALICELVDWARTAGFEVVCAGKGTRYLPHYHQSTPDTVWQNFAGDFDAGQAAAEGLNPKMYNSFLDGTKSGIEMTAVANACGLTPPTAGLGFPACSADDLAHVCRPRQAGGSLERSGTVEVVSSRERDGRLVPHDLQWGVYVTFSGASDYSRHSLSQYGLAVDDSGAYAAMYRPYHLIGLELGISVANAALRGEPTGAAKGWSADVVATAKRDLAAGESLDGEGGFTVWGRLMPAERSQADGALPIGLASGVELVRDVRQGEVVGWADVRVDEASEAVAFRRQMEAAFGRPDAAAAAE